MKDMTQGSLSGKMIRFAAPMIAGNIFQQLYNAVASIIVGEQAFAAVGVAGSIMNLAMFVIVGLCMGSMVLMSEMVGSKRFDTLKRELSSTMLAGSGFTVLLSAAAIAMINPLLRAINTPDELVPEVRGYLVIIFSGLLFTFLYNNYSSAFFAVGDSKTPLCVLIVSSIVNAGLTSWFVILCGLGVAGAALATIISQALSAVLCAGYIYLREPQLALRRGEWVVDRGLLKRTLHYSWISALQQSCVHIGKLLVQGAVNPLGVSTIAAFNAVTRIDGFLIAPADSINNTVSTFVSQNHGAKQHARARRGVYAGLRIGLVYSVAVGIIVFIFLPGEIIGMFVQAESREILLAGVTYLRPMAFFYLLAFVNSCFQGYFRGSGLIRFTLMGSLVQIVIRVVLSWLAAPHIGILGVSIASGLGWGIMLVFEGTLFLRYRQYAVDVELQ